MATLVTGYLIESTINKNQIEFNQIETNYFMKHIFYFYLYERQELFRWSQDRKEHSCLTIRNPIPALSIPNPTPASKISCDIPDLHKLIKHHIKSSKPLLTLLRLLKRCFRISSLFFVKSFLVCKVCSYPV